MTKMDDNNYSGPLADPIILGHLMCMANAVEDAVDYAAFIDELADMLRKEHTGTWNSYAVAEIMRLLCCAFAMRDEIDDWDEGARRLAQAVCGPVQSDR